jgi:hypothetical protein
LLNLLNSYRVSDRRRRRESQTFSFAPAGLAAAFTPTHGLRRGLHSFAASRL